MAEQVILPAPGFTHWPHRLYRAAAHRLLTSLPEGSLELYENGHLVLRHGIPAPETHAVIEVTHPDFYRRLLRHGSIGAAESFIDGEWHSPELTNVVRLVARNLAWLDKIEARMTLVTRLANQLQHRFRRNSRTQARQNILQHYDLGNALYSRFLDREMMYSAALFTSEHDDLEQAQLDKLKALCDKLQLKPADHLLEIGTGWGGLAIYAARHYGCRVTTTTISDAQFDYAQKRIAEEGLSERITLLKRDYRELTGSYDKLVSVEMIEAVGQAYLPHFFAQCDRLLKADGIMVLQSITIADQRLATYSRSVDFIQKHIFPGGFLPSVHLLTDHIQAHTQMVVRHLDDMGLDYAKTLRIWWQRFHQNLHELRLLGYDERFARLWQFYLNYCEGGFLERATSAVQLVATKSRHVGPAYRQA